ncbi:Crp/Fnr family transcriptional regulator [Mesorhizobium sp. KR9-304]|uniref:Crp/Fnr family transcriptional regulator n=1 Tax=Mesorhizobium sp. KR9-304 TaxID=3156614 RepID=UPI0032B4E2B7
MAHIGKAAASQIMSGSGWLTAVPPEVRAEVLRRSNLLHFAAEEPVFRLDDPAGGIYGLASGTVSVSVAPAGATPRLVLLGIPGHWTGEGCFLTRKPRRADMKAVVDTTMLHLPLDAMDKMAAKNPHFVHHVAQILMMTVEFLFRVIHDLQKADAAKRIAAVLHRATSSGETPVPLTQTEVGIMANASRKQVNAALRKFSETGWVQNGYRAITVTDAVALRRFAGSN